MKQGLVRLLYNSGKRFMGWTLHMIMCVLLCYPVSIHMSQLLSTGRPISSSNHSCLLVVVPIVLGIVTQIVNTLQFLLSIHQPLSQPNILVIVLPLMLLRSGMNSLKIFAVQHQLPPSGRSLKHTCLQKPTHHSLPCYVCVSLV